MSTFLPTADGDDRPARVADLIDYFHRGSKPVADYRIGAEFEKFALDRRTGQQIGFDGPNGIEQILRHLADRFGWEPHFEADRLTTLSRGGATVSVEPGGQVELSTPPSLSIADVHRELDRHLAELRAVSDAAWVGIGYTPFSRVEDIPMNPRRRHHLMAEYLPTRCPRGLEMMKATASTQAAFDYCDEADAMRKFRIGLTLGPVVNAVFANAPLMHGLPAGVASVRGSVWQGMDPDRSGHLPQLLAGELSFERYTNHALDVPLLFVADGEELLPAGGATFRDFLAHGLNGRLPTLRDWELHLSTIFTDVRLKQFLEVRGADATPAARAVCVPAVWAGLFYDATALDAASEMATAFDPASLTDLSATVAQQGLAATYRGLRVGVWATEVFRLAADGLKRNGRSDVGGFEEAFTAIELGRVVAFDEPVSPARVMAAFAC